MGQWPPHHTASQLDHPPVFENTSLRLWRRFCFSRYTAQGFYAGLCTLPCFLLLRSRARDKRRQTQGVKVYIGQENNWSLSQTLQEGWPFLKWSRHGPRVCFVISLYIKRIARGWLKVSFPPFVSQWHQCITTKHLAIDLFPFPLISPNHQSPLFVTTLQCSSVPASAPSRCASNSELNVLHTTLESRANQTDYGYFVVKWCMMTVDPRSRICGFETRVGNDFRSR